MNRLFFYCPRSLLIVRPVDESSKTTAQDEKRPKMGGINDEYDRRHSHRLSNSERLMMATMLRSQNTKIKRESLSQDKLQFPLIHTQ